MTGATMVSASAAGVSAFHGVVFNAVDTTQRHYRGYSYGYYDAYRREPAGTLGVNDADTVMPKRLEPEHAA